jgi:hypothetical protein
MFKPHNFANENEDEYDNGYDSESDYDSESESDLIDSDFEG